MSPVGLCAIASAKLFSPSKIILVDMDEFRLGVGQQVGADQEDVLAVINELTN